MVNKKEVLSRRLNKCERHCQALTDYKELINQLEQQLPIYEATAFQQLKAADKAIFDAYLKRFAALKDYLGAKVFPLLMEVSGIGGSKMSEVLQGVEKEGIIGSLGEWVELREIRNELEHDYPDELQKGLNDLRLCVEKFQCLTGYYEASKRFAGNYL